MATIPVQTESDEVVEVDFVAARLPGWTVEVLRREGKHQEAEEELERLVMEGVDSGPGIPVTDRFWVDLRAEVIERAKQEHG